jgi:enamine deaminase RidA (YjgF/YER057c/UK114 family)
MTSGVEPLGAVRIAGGDIHYAQGMKAGGWVFLTGHEAVDFDTGLAPEVAGKPGFPLHGLPRHRREGDFILRRFEDLLGKAGTDLAHGVRLDQYYPTWKAVDPYHHARRAAFGDYIPPSTSVLMSEVLHAGAAINASLLAVLPGEGRDPRRVQTNLAAPRWSGFAPVVTSGDYVFLAGHMAHHAGKTGVDPSAHVPDDNLWGGTEIILQTEFILRELIAPGLKAAGSSIANVVKAQAYLSSVEDVPLFMQVWNAWFRDAPCALSVIPTAGFGSVGGIVEINFLAVKDAGTVHKQIVACDIPSTMAYGPPAVRAGDLLLLSGLMATDEAGAISAVRTGAAMPYHAVGARAQMRRILETAQRICRAAGTSLENVVRAHQFHTDLAEFHPMHTVWQELLPGRPIPYGAVRVPAPMPAPGCTVITDLWVYAP